MVNTTKENNHQKDNEFSGHDPFGPYKTMIDFWQKYSIDWIKKYEEFINDIQRMSELQKESLKTIEKMGELYKEMLLNVEKMNKLYKESIRITDKMTRYWLEYATVFSKKDNE